MGNQSLIKMVGETIAGVFSSETQEDIVGELLGGSGRRRRRRRRRRRSRRIRDDLGVSGSHGCSKID